MPSSDGTESVESLCLLVHTLHEDTTEFDSAFLSPHQSTSTSLCPKMAAAPANCDDRVNHPALVGPCHPRRINCVENTHAAPFSVCNTCINDTVMNQLFPPGPNPHSPFNRLTQHASPRIPRNTNLPVAFPQTRGFWTYLCDDCTSYEERLWWRRMQGTEPAAVRIPLAERAFMNHPDTTCICFSKMLRMHVDGNGNPYRHCYDCRLLSYNRIWQTRTANEQWLEDTERVPNGRQTARAGSKTRRERDAAGFYRACRCGNTISGLPIGRTVMMCLACEGIDFSITPPAPPAPPPGLFRPFGRRIDLQRPRINRNANLLG